MPDYARARRQMVENQIRRRGIADERVLAAMREVPREIFVEKGFEEFAYEDSALPIAERQTISQPYIVALMIEAAEIAPGARVLEVGAGSGYAAAVMSRIADEVYAIERREALVRTAQERFDRLDYDNIELKAGDGVKGWPEAAPFDAILVAAGGPGAPAPLKEQLKIGGRLIIPIGGASHQSLRRIRRKAEDAYEEDDFGLVAFVPLIVGRG